MQAIVASVDAIVTQKSPKWKVLEIECDNEPIVIPVDLTTKKVLQNAETEIKTQPTTNSYDSSTVTIPPNDEGDMSPNNFHIFETGIESQPMMITYDLDAIPTTSNLSVIETGTQNEPVVLPIELSSGNTNNCPDIVRLAMEGLEGMDYASLAELDIPEGMDINLTDEYRCDPIVESMTESFQNIPHSVLVDVRLNGCNFGDNQKTLELATDNSLSTPSSMSKQKEITLPVQERHGFSVQKIDYKKAYLQLKEKNANLDERNMALQNALVAADKALGKIPEVPYAAVDGGRLYREGVYLDEVQCKILDTTSDSNKYVNNLAVAVFGTETLKKSSVTGTASKNKKLPAKAGLNPLWLQLVYDLTEAKTNKRLSVSEVNKILNKKISNLNGAEKRKLTKLNGAAQRISDEQNNAKNGKVCDVAAPTEK